MSGKWKIFLCLFMPMPLGLGISNLKTKNLKAKGTGMQDEESLWLKINSRRCLKSFKVEIVGISSFSSAKSSWFKVAKYKITHYTTFGASSPGNKGT